MKRSLYGFPYSSCTHRVKLMMSLLGIECEDKLVDLAKGAQRSPEFLALNPVGQVPVLVEDDAALFDSHAILLYLAETYGGQVWWPPVAWQRALVSQWLFFDANELHNSIGAARNVLTFGIPGDAAPASRRAAAALATMESRLGERDWLELGRPTIADVACCPLVEVAGEAGLDLSPFPGVHRWLENLRALPGYVKMPRLRR